MKRFKSLLAAAGLLLLAPASSYAIPTLQLYIEGSVYDSSDETWTIDSSNFKLWVLGETDKTGTIYDVNLVVAHLTGETGSITFTPTTATAGLLPPPGDASTPGAPPVLNGSGSETVPITGDGSELPSHGIYGAGTDWDTYLLGDFSLQDSPIGDYTTGECPGAGCTWPALGQINAYDVAVTGYSWVHFDAFDHVISDNKTKYINFPFSHDANTTSVPEPNTLILLGSGFLGLWALKRKVL